MSGWTFSKNKTPYTIDQAELDVARLQSDMRSIMDVIRPVPGLVNFLKDIEIEQNIVFDGTISGQAISNLFVATPSIDFVYNGDVPSMKANVLPAGVDHDLLMNFVVNEHIDHSGVTIIAGNGLTGGGYITASRTLAVGAGTMISVDSDTVGVSNGANYQFIGTNIGGEAAWKNISSLAGNGLNTNNGVLLIGQGDGITVNANDVALTIPGTLSVSSINSAAGNHMHDITTSSNPGANASILASNASGYLQLERLGLGVSPLYPLHVVGESRLDGDLTFVGAQSILTTADSLTLSPAANLILTPGGNAQVRLTSGVRLQSDNYASQTTGWGVSYTGSGDFRYLYADELHARSFIADLEQALAGGQIISKSVAVLAEDFIVPAPETSSNLVVESFNGFPAIKVFVDGDLVRLRQFDRTGTSLSVTDCWGTVVWSSTNEGIQTYTFTRSASPNGGAATDGSTINAGTLALDYGTTGNGYIEQNAIDGVMGENSPYIQAVNWKYHPAFDGGIGAMEIGSSFIVGGAGLKVRTRLGNLKGIFNVVDEFGFYAGAGVTDSDQYLRISNEAVEAHNLPISLYDGASTTVKLDPDVPSFALGATLPAGFGTGTGIWMGKDGDGNYKFRVGNPYGQRITWDGTNLNVNGTVTITGGSGLANLSDFPSTLKTPSGAGLFLSSSHMGYYDNGVWKTYMDNNGAFYFKGSASGAVRWVPASNQLQGYDGTNVQWYADADDGKLYAGDGDVVLDESGIVFSCPTDSPTETNSIKWKDDAGYEWAKITSFTANNSALMRVNIDRKSTAAAAGFEINFLDNGSYVGAGLFAFWQATDGTMHSLMREIEYLDIEDGYLMLGYEGLLAPSSPQPGDIYAKGTIYANGNIRAAGDFISYKNSTEYKGYLFVPLTTPLTSTSWDGDSYSTTAKTKIDLSAVFGVPAGVKAVKVVVAVRDSGSATGDYLLCLSPNNSNLSGPKVSCGGKPNNYWAYSSFDVNCDSNGDIYYQIIASGIDTLDAYIEIWGYWI